MTRKYVPTSFVMEAVLCFALGTPKIKLLALNVLYQQNKNTQLFIEHFTREMAVERFNAKDR